MKRAKPIQTNTPIVLISAGLSGTQTKEMIEIIEVCSPEPNNITIESNSNEPTMPYRFKQQLPIMPPSLNDLNWSTNPFNILASLAVVRLTALRPDERYSPQSPELSDSSPILKHPMNLSTVEGWETSSEVSTFDSEDEPRRIYLLSKSAPSPPPRKQRRKRSIGMLFAK